MGAFVIIVGVLLMVVIHEAAHFVAAKAFGMKATEAFFGFGPKLWSIRRGETEYGVKALPLGGYVRIIGMNPFEDVAAEDVGRTYRENPFWKKSIVVLAGIASHFVVAYVLFVALALAFGVGRLTTEVAAVSQVVAQPVDVPHAEPLVLYAGDQIVAIDDVPFDEWQPTAKEAGETTKVDIERDGSIVTVVTTDQLAPAPASGVDLQPGDVLVGFDGREVDTWQEFQDLAQQSPGKTVVIDLVRDGERRSVTATLATRVIDGTPEGFFGVSPVSVVDDVGFFAALGQGGKSVGSATVAAAQGLAGLVVHFDDLIGAVFSNDTQKLDQVRPVSPIGLVRIAGPFEVGIELLAFVNVFVGVLNVVPLYPLDGGHFSVALYEKIRGRSADVRKLLPVAAAVFAFIVLLGLLGFYFDIVDPLRLPE